MGVVYLAGLIILFGYIYLRSPSIVMFIEKNFSSVIDFIYFKLGVRVFSLERRFARRARLNNKGLISSIYEYFDLMLRNLNLKKDNVTVTGLLVFISSVAISLTLLSWYFLELGTFMGLLFWFTLGSIFFFTLTVFRLMALTLQERREAIVMDAVDLLVSDVRGGIFNAITKYRDSFHPSVQPYFKEFLNTATKIGFRTAMENLNEALGHEFTDFAQKAIIYEEKADSTYDTIFSDIIENNRHKRALRHENQEKFNILRIQFVVSFGMILAYCLYLLKTEPYVRNFMLGTSFGKGLLIADFVILVSVLAYLVSLKAKEI